nr:MAG TPA: Corticotropin ACTH domain protein [Caudoviricetes sp.]
MLGYGDDSLFQISRAMIAKSSISYKMHHFYLSH